MTNLLMILLLLCMIAVFGRGIKYEESKQELLSVNDSIFLRGFWSIVVVLVHIPQTYQNKIQDIIGSFGYIGVTFFFLTSAFGLKNKICKKDNYLKMFWKKRLPKLLLPMLLVNIIDTFLIFLEGETITLFSLIKMNNWVKVLLIHYFVFWVIYYVSISPQKHQRVNVSAPLS